METTQPRDEAAGVGLGGLAFAFDRTEPFALASALTPPVEAGLQIGSGLGTLASVAIRV